jgi:hypothetical protein
VDELPQKHNPTRPTPPARRPFEPAATTRADLPATRRPDLPGAAPNGSPRRRPVLGIAILFALLATSFAYLPFVGKGFVSEDWLLIRLHRESPPWEDLGATFAGPWLGMHVFQFYRPVAALLFATEASLFGAWSPGYDLVHVLAHLLATATLMALVWRLLTRDAVPLEARSPARTSTAVATGVAGLFFGLYPWTPNAVLFAASFATVFGGLATLGSAALYVWWRQGTEGKARVFGRPWILAGSVVLYAAALGCYEGSTALPAWLALYELTGLAVARRWRWASLALIPFALLALAYLALRDAIFGEVLGGYAHLAAQLRSADFTLVGSALRALLHLPSPGLPTPGVAGNVGLEIAVALAVVAALAAWLAMGERALGERGLGERGRRAGTLRIFVLGLGWILVFQAPFLFEVVVPAQGRYWYLAAAGGAIALAVLIDRATQARHARAVQVTLAALAVVVVLGRNTGLLLEHLGWMQRAGGTAERIADEVVATATRLPETPLFVADYPLFVQSASGVNLAQIYHYGLRSSVGPPFRSEPVDAYPLPSSDRADSRRMARDFPVFRWREPEQRLERWVVDPSGLPAELEVLGGPPPNAAVLPEDASALAVRLASPTGAPARVVVVATGNVSVEAQRVDESGQVQLPGEFFRFWERLEPGPQYWWIEILDESGAVDAQSAPRRILVLPPR